MIFFIGNFHDESGQPCKLPGSVTDWNIGSIPGSEVPTPELGGSFSTSVTANGGVTSYQFPFRCDELLVEDIEIERNPVDGCDFSFGVVLMDNLFIAISKKRDREGTRLIGMYLLLCMFIPD